MTNGIYPHDLSRDDESVSTWSEFSQRLDIPDESEWRNPLSSVYSTVGKTIRSWIRSPVLPDASFSETSKASDVSNASGLPFGNLRMTLEEVNQLTGDVSKMSLVRQWPNGRVYRATLSTGEAAAVTMLIDPALSQTNFVAQLSKVSRLKHENVVKLLGYCLDSVSDDGILLHQFATMGSLHDILHGSNDTQGPTPMLMRDAHLETQNIQGPETGPVLTWNQRVKIAFGAARGLEYLHKEHIVHGALTSSDILIFDEFVSKITDIRFRYPPTYASLTRLPPPQISELHPSAFEGYNLQEAEYAYEVFGKYDDVYRFGVVLLELLTGRKHVDLKIARGPVNQNYLNWATPTLSKDRVYGCIDPKLKNDYPPEALAKMADIAVLCVQIAPPTMEIVVKAIQPLLQ